jgi:hypothetical protein
LQYKQHSLSLFFSLFFYWVESLAFFLLANKKMWNSGKSYSNGFLLGPATPHETRKWWAGQHPKRKCVEQKNMQSRHQPTQTKYSVGVFFIVSLTDLVLNTKFRPVVVSVTAGTPTGDSGGDMSAVSGRMDGGKGVSTATLDDVLNSLLGLAPEVGSGGGSHRADRCGILPRPTSQPSFQHSKQRSANDDRHPTSDAAEIRSCGDLRCSRSNGTLSSVAGFRWTKLFFKQKTWKSENIFYNFVFYACCYFSTRSVDTFSSEK